MDLRITKRLPCSVCGLDSHWRNGWFLVAENRWRDRLKIFTWHRSLASQRGFKSACSQEHLKVLVAYWLDQADLRLISPTLGPLPLGSDSSLEEIDASAANAGRLVGELSVYREAGTRTWTGSAAALQEIIDSLLPGGEADSAAAPGVRIFQPPQERSYRLFLH
ncbi:MAG: hypothetical protein WBS24_00035 [Terriglobales bacterium]